MSVATQNYVYQVLGKKNPEKKEPILTSERLAEIKKSVGKYLIEKK